MVKLSIAEQAASGADRGSRYNRATHYQRPKQQPKLRRDLRPKVLRATSKFRSQGSSPGGDHSSQRDELNLLVAWPEPLKVFAENASDRIHGRVVPKVETTSAPDHEFWSDIDLEAPFPRRGLTDSVFAHAALLGLLYAVSIWPQSKIHLGDTHSSRMLNGYKLSAYLPELHGAPTHRRHKGKDDPVLARQEIRSLPDAPDNLRQTIVTPPKVKLQHDVLLPNIVAYEPALPVQPMEASARASSLRLPAMLPEVVAPAAETGSLHSRKKTPSLVPLVVEPTPELSQIKPRLVLPEFAPDVVQPAPEVGAVRRGSSGSLSRVLGPAAEPVPPVPQVGDARHGAGQLVALSLHPAEVNAPLEVPLGNRRGAFAASPAGRAEATGTPGAESSPGSGARENKGAVNAPAGISVGAAKAPAAAVASPTAQAAKPGAADPALRAKFLAAMRPPPVTSLPPRQPVAREATGARSELENRIFAGRRSYTLAVNMPNLNTATGSWIIHFVERDPGEAKSPIAAPEVVSKSDPAYPGELIRDGIQGTVILTAIIRADGSVSDIAVVKSLDPRLDENAVQALSRWLFRPALKDGLAIDLEAVITVPFRTKAIAY